MKTTLCTLYNSLYLDKGLVLYDSLKECAQDFELYVLCMDEKCYEVLSNIGEDRLKPLHLVDVENDKMLIAKSNRTVAEYCWTCSSRLIQYILETYQSSCCTYIDADMYFYNDPQVLVDEMIKAGKSVMMVPHRFTERNQSLADKVGTYCVEFNCFKNDAAGLEVLNHWHNQCLECCSNIGDGIHWGDQKYMDEWPVLYPDKVHVCENPGAGIAPWNIEWYQYSNTNDNVVIYKKDMRIIPIIFYHFQDIKYLTRKEINISINKNSKNIDYQLVKKLYLPYLLTIERTKVFISARYGIDLLIKNHPSQKKQKGIRSLIKSTCVVKFAYNLIKKNMPYIICINDFGKNI